MQILYALPTRQNGGENRDKDYFGANRERQRMKHTINAGVWFET